MAVIEQELTEQYAVYNADCMEVLPTLPSDSVHFSVYSPPFPELYQYSNDPRDMSNCAKYEEGIEQYQYVVNEIERATMPGRLTAVHCMDLKKGSWTQRDFPGDIVRAHEQAGFGFICRVTIWKDPWLIARRTRMKSLRHKNICEDSATVRIGPADYVLIFKKGGVNPEKIRHPDGLKTYAGETEIPEELYRKYKNYKGDQRKNLLSHWIWRRYASPVWMDIRSGRLMPFEESKESDEEKHVCPLQLDVIERLLTLYSNPGDTVLTPFMGVGSEVYESVEMGRRAIGIELKPSYYRQSLRNLQSIGKNNPEVEEKDLFSDVEEFEEVDSL
ncbi:MAG: site-specific DNA-methyltransferase [Desulfurellales bacterium]|nr:MAG: site-specific DNA-methyltransferase [Desulfurellales bacterium]